MNGELARLERYLWRNPVTGCWIWRGSTSDEGYGMANKPDGQGGWKTVMAHRYMYELVTGDQVDSSLHLDHLCLVPRCVNPQHLDPVTPAENLRRRNALMNVCRNGHERTPENTYFRPGGNKSKGCLDCERERTRRYKASRRGGVA